MNTIPSNIWSICNMRITSVQPNQYVEGKYSVLSMTCCLCMINSIRNCIHVNAHQFGNATILHQSIPTIRTDDDQASKFLPFSHSSQVNLF